MKIAMMVRGYLPVPRPLDIIYAPIDLAVDIAEGLAQRGHQVDFYAPLGSKLHRVTVQDCQLRPLVHSQQEFRDLLSSSEMVNHYIPGLWDQHFATEMFARAAQGKYDLLYFHHPEIAMPLAQQYNQVPVAYTLHDPIYPWYKEVFELYHSPNQHYISISKNQRRDAPDLAYASTVYNGIDVKEFPYNEHPEDYLLFAGRITPEKGVKEAVQIAQMTNHRLLIIGPVTTDHQGYFDQYIKPHLNDKILHLGYIERHHLARYYQNAKALLMPIQWEEPFGLAMTEAMACGTPVLANKRGSIPEVVKDGVTGFVTESLSDMAAAVDKVATLSRQACRDHVEKHFSVKQMVDGYEAAFKAILKAPRKKLSRTYVTTKLREAFRANVPTPKNQQLNLL